MPSTIYLDECGYTGEDLLDPAQPIFTIATHRLDEARAAELKAEFFGHVKADSLKHKDLRRRPRHQNAIVGLMRRLIETHGGDVRVGVAHKPYALTAKVVDLLLEPVMHEDGLDLYEDGGNVALSSMLFQVMQAGDSPALFEILKPFQDLVRHRTPEAWQAFADAVARPQPIPIIEQVTDEFIRTCLRRQRLADIESLPVPSLDLSLTLALALMCGWRQSGLRSIRVVHDASKNMNQQKHLWDGILAADAPPAYVGTAAMAVQFPIGVEETVFENDAESVGVQIADVVAGAVTRWAGWIVEGQPAADTYAARLDEILGPLPEPFFTWAMFPGEIERRPMPEGVASSLDYLTERVKDLV